MKHHLFPFVILVFACQPQNERKVGLQFKPPTVVDGKGYMPPAGKVLPPVVVTATPPAKRMLGKPEIVKVASNVFPARISSTIEAGAPKIQMPGGSVYKGPQVVPAIDSPYVARPPEVISVDAPHYSETSTGLFSTIKAKDGLHSDEISSLMQDKDGNLWIGEWWGGGICRFDGSYLWNYSIRQGLSSEVVNYIYEDNKQNIWIATYDNGVDRFDGEYITHYSIKEGLQDNLVYYILGDKDGNIWFGTNNGLAKFDGKLFTHYTTAQGLPSNKVRCLMEDSKGQLWVGADGGLCMFDGHSFLNYTTALNFDERTEIPSIMEDNGSIWFASNIGLFKYDGKVFRQYTTESGLSSNVITKIIKEHNGDLWIGTRGGGAVRFDGNSFIHYGPEQGLANDRVTSILQDKWGNIWLGTTGGVCKYEGQIFSHVMPLKQEEIEAMLPDRNGNVWMGSGTDSCLNKYNGTHMMRYAAGSGLFNTEFNYIFQDKQGDMWFATWDGVDKYDGTYLTHYSTGNGLVDSVVFCMAQDKYGNYWFGTRKGLSKFDGKTFTQYTRDQGLCGEIIFSILEDHSGRIWIGTNDNGVCTFDGTRFTHYPKTNLSHPMVVGMTEDRNNNIWLCTAYGVDKFDGKRFTWYTTEQGLTNNITKDVLEDRNGDIWIGCLTGLNRFIGSTIPGDSMITVTPSYFKNYTTTDGFSGAGTYENSMHMDQQGIIWIGSNDRLTRYHREGDTKDTIAPVLKLTDISLFNEKISWQHISQAKDHLYLLPSGRRLGNIRFTGLSRWYNQPEHLELPYDNNNITFQFIGISTNRQKQIRYRYMLDGIDKTWTITSQPTAVYNQLSHGTFDFRVQCENSEGYWSNEVHYSFKIFPPWWQTRVAYFSYALALGMFIWVFTWYRSKRLRAENLLLEEKVMSRTNELKQSIEERYRLSEQIKSQQALLNERLRISRDLHDEIGSTLGSISIYSEVAKKRSEKNENPVTVLSKIGTASRELIEKMSDIVWSLNLKDENFEQMQHRMRAFATMILAPRNIRYTLDVDENSARVQLTNAQAKNIFLIFKESLYNIVKYAECSSACITFRTEGKALVMSIVDDGKGFDQSAYSDIIPADQQLGGNGIKNMHVRADEMKATVTINSQVNKGTTVTLSVHL